MSKTDLNIEITLLAALANPLQAPDTGLGIPAASTWALTPTTCEPALNVIAPNFSPLLPAILISSPEMVQNRSEGKGSLKNIKRKS